MESTSSESILLMLVEIVILLLLSGFFSSSETAMTATGKIKLKELIENEKSQRKKKLLELVLNHPNLYLTTILIANNLVNILASSLTTVFVMSIFPNAVGTAVGIATGIMTFLILIFGEITPKILAQQRFLTLFKFSYPVIGTLTVILKPVIWILVKIADIVVKILGLEPVEETPIITEVELINYVDIGHEAGVIEKEEKYLVKKSLELKEMTVKEIMTPRVDIVALEDTSTLKDLIETVNEEGYSRIPIYKETIDNIIGICRVKDFFKILEEKGFSEETLQLPVKTIMHEPEFVPITMKVDDLLQIFLDKRTHMAIVVDEYGGTAGLVTLEDILEELTGEILDEYDILAEERNIIKISENVYLVDGSTPINDIERELDMELPKSEFETIGGFVLERLGRFPNVREKIEFEDLILEVVAISKNKVDKVKIIVKKEERKE